MLEFMTPQQNIYQGLNLRQQPTPGHSILYFEKPKTFWAATRGNIARSITNQRPTFSRNQVPASFTVVGA